MGTNWEKINCRNDTAQYKIMATNRQFSCTSNPMKLHLCCFSYTSKVIRKLKLRRFLEWKLRELSSRNLTLIASENRSCGTLWYSDYSNGSLNLTYKQVGRCGPRIRSVGLECTLYHGPSFPEVYCPWPSQGPLERRTPSRRTPETRANPCIEWRRDLNFGHNFEQVSLPYSNIFGVGPILGLVRQITRRHQKR